MAKLPVKNGFVVVERELSATQSALYGKIAALEKAGTPLPKPLLAAKRKLERAREETAAAMAIHYRGETLAKSVVHTGKGAVALRKFAEALLQSAPQMDAAAMVAAASAAFACGKSHDAVLYRDAQVRFRLRVVVDARGKTFAWLVIESMKTSVRCAMSSDDIAEARALRKPIAQSVAMLQKAAGKRAERE